MRTQALMVLVALASLVPAAAPASASSVATTPSIRRLALVAGANEGGAGRVKLRYAATDARAVGRVLEQLGGLASSDVLMLAEPDRASLLEGFDRLAERSRAAQAGSSRVEVIVYYSGHSDENGLLLGTERLSYPELRAAIALVPADVRVAILDSCASGALIRAKGGRRLPSFLVDGSSEVRGHAFLTASSADEAAQESDRIGGSFFTYALLTGLRGAADSTRDGRVTLTEAYQFAFTETLARTEKLHGGPQHPAYDIQLAGTGDLVMTDLRGTSAGLVLADELDGRIYLRDASGRLAAELRKIPGAPIELGLEPGLYEVMLDSNGALSRGRVELAEGRRTRLDAAQLASIEGERATPHGVAATPAASAHRVVPVNLALVPSVSVNAVVNAPAINYFALNVVGRSARLHGFEFGLGANTESEAVRGAQVATGANLVEGDLIGTQLAAGLNLATGPVLGAQIAGGVNLAGPMRFAQLAGGVNVARGEVAGLQVAGAVNVATKDSTGLQIAGGANLAPEALSGLQIAGGANIGGLVHGGQLAPVNYAGEVFGQLGVVNVARKSAKLQIGVVNQGEDTAVPIGVVNIIKNGYLRVGLWGSDVAAGNLGIKMGGRHVYTILTGGMQPRDGAPRWTTGAGIGGHVPVASDFFVDVDAIASNTYFGSEFQHAALLSTLRVVAGWQILPRLALTAGPTLNVTTAWDGTDLDLALGPQWELKSGETTVRIFPGFVIGLQI